MRFITFQITVSTIGNYTEKLYYCFTPFLNTFSLTPVVGVQFVCFNFFFNYQNFEQYLNESDGENETEEDVIGQHLSSACSGSYAPSMPRKAVAPVVS